MGSVLILGGARSGKSARAMALAEAHTPCPIYIATAPRLDGDAEWRARIAHHRKTRGPHW
ncbi:MAG: bifunctional adenosylcobinamide kinase/adenosylcobinamide-phosphate guanylyltransferase, partial [Zetaproteobacteria bacterium]